MPVKPLLAAFVVVPLLAAGGRASDACSPPGAERPVVRLAGLDVAGDLVLADGRRLRLVGLAPRQDEAEAARFAAGIGRWYARDFGLVILGEADRWGRLPARLQGVPGAGDAPPDLAAALVSEGAAVALPEALTARCEGATFPRTASARRRGPAPAQTAAAAAPTKRVLEPSAIDGHDLAALKAQEGRVVLLEGRIASVGERAQRTYLNFSRRRGEAASIVISKRLWREMQDGGWTATGVSGKRLRARGVLSGRDGLLLDVTSTLALELID